LLQSLYGLFLTICDPNACFFVDETFNRLALGSPGYRFLSCLGSSQKTEFKVR